MFGILSLIGIFLLLFDKDIFGLSKLIKKNDKCNTYFFICFFFVGTYLHKKKL